MAQSDEQKTEKEPSIQKTRENDNKIIPKITCKSKTTCINKTKKCVIRADKNF